MHRCVIHGILSLTSSAAPRAYLISEIISLLERSLVMILSGTLPVPLTGELGVFVPPSLSGYTIHEIIEISKTASCTKITSSFCATCPVLSICTRAALRNDRIAAPDIWGLNRYSVCDDYFLYHRLLIRRYCTVVVDRFRVLCNLLGNFHAFRHSAESRIASVQEG